MTVTIMIDGSIKRTHKFGFKLQSLCVIEKRYNIRIVRGNASPSLTVINITMAC